MLCWNCLEGALEGVPEGLLGESGSPEVSGGAKLANSDVRCGECGASIGAESAEALKRKYTQLESFGLAGRAKPVLEPKRPCNGGNPEVA